MKNPIIDGWFFRYVAGVCLEGFGWETLTVEPRKVNGLNRFSASIRGIRVEKNKNNFMISSEYPFKLLLDGYSGDYAAGDYVFSEAKN